VTDALERRWGAQRAALLIALGCGLLGALLFLPAIGSGRLADDYVLLHTVRQVKSVFWPFSHNDLGQPAGSGHFYRPLWVLWNTAIYELSHGPTLEHVLNLVLFAAICCEVVFLIRRLAGLRAALVGGLLFAVFPSHGESVAWISGNTDLLVVVVGLAAVLVALSSTRSLLRDVALVVLTAAAMLCKEIAVVLPLLVATLVWAAPSLVPGTGVARWRPVILMAVAIVAVLIARTVVISGLGGYGPSLTAKRGVGSLASFTIAALSAPQLGLFEHLALLLVPLGLLGLFAWRVIDAWRTDRSTARIATAAVGWFVIALVPVLNQPLNLNTRNGDRLLLLPSVGIALLAGVLFGRVRNRTVGVGCLALASLCAVSCVANAFAWRTAGIETKRILADIDRLAPPHSHLIALSYPTDYRAAHLFPDALDTAVQETGHPDVTLVSCVPVHAIDLRRDQVSFTPGANGSWLGRATNSAPFSFSVFGSSAQSSPQCAVTKGPDQSSQPLGTALAAIATPTAGARTWIPIYFDGRDMVRATQ
jgi:hypothetical protein